MRATGLAECGTVTGGSVARGATGVRISVIDR